ncbi:MAG: ATP-dependent DNA helicase RecQ [Bacteroidetes bacterium ADurb.Bin408]|nr:MAG: ATP-dependent DNA helicase RecQ [Bacteroidetes bacterium ADurb.Bin408]
MDFDNNEPLQLAYEFVQHTSAHVFLTGKAGTGKTTFLHQLRKTTPKRMVVVAPTGVAAINAGGVTMHSFFQLSFGPQLAHLIDQKNKGNAVKQDYVKKFNREKIKLIKCTDLLVIDEISMVRADMLDAVDEILRRFKDPDKPFGGTQLLMIGDLQQLSPVIKEDEWKLLKDHYDTVYFFSSKALRQTQVVNIELTHIYRQSEAHFINILGKIRDNKADTETLKALNARYLPDFNPDEKEGYIILTTHNATAHNINKQKLDALKRKTFTFSAVTEGDFFESIYPTDAHLELKEGAQVMFVKNDSKREKQYYNGKIARVKTIDDDTIYVVSPEDNTEIAVERETWHNVKYSLNDTTKEIEEQIVGKFTQFPLKLAWAITIHKSQGLTFDKAIIDAGSSFAFGQVYVALSRCRSFEGMVLRSPISQQAIKSDRFVSEYTEDIGRTPPDSAQLKALKIQFQKEKIAELFSFDALLYRFSRLKKLVSDNGGVLHQGVTEQLLQVETAMINDLCIVSEKFGKQLIQLYQAADIPAENMAIQDRVTKASAYFAGKTRDIFKDKLSHISFETDNKEISKVLDESTDALMKEAHIKLSCLEACKDSFDTVKYIKAKTNADITYKPLALTKTSQMQDNFMRNLPHPVLYKHLRQWRQAVSETEEVPVYMVLPQKSMARLLAELPATPFQLKKIKGIGKIKATRYGQEILEIINSYCLENGIIRDTAEQEEPVMVKKQKEASHAITLRLLREGHSIGRISEIQKLALSTIEGHIARHIGSGNVSIFEVMEKDKAESIIRYFHIHGDASMHQAKNALGDSVTYSELRYVLNHLRSQSGGH